VWIRAAAAEPPPDIYAVFMFGAFIFDYTFSLPGEVFGVVAFLVMLVFTFCVVVAGMVAYQTPAQRHTTRRISKAVLIANAASYSLIALSWVVLICLS